MNETEKIFFETDDHGKYTVVSISGRADANSAIEFQQQLEQIVARGARVLILNLEKLKYISSAGLRVILTIAKKVRAREGDLWLAGLSGPINKVIQISGFPSIMKCFASLDEALAEQGPA